MKKPRKSDIDEFMALTDAQKERMVRQLDDETLEQTVSRSRPLSAGDRKAWRRFKARTGRPKIGKGARTISLTVERGLLQQADEYARRHGISRARLVAQGLRTILENAA